MFGRKVSSVTRRKLSEANKGKIGTWAGQTLSEEHKRKMSETHKARREELVRAPDGCFVSPVS